MILAAGAAWFASSAVAQDLDLGEVDVGDVGYALTEGPDGIERFAVEVLGIRAPDGPGSPLLLIRTSGPFLDRVGGVAAGMSGSPVFLGPPGQERLVGALAYAFPDSDHRLAMVTPIAAMRALAGDATNPTAPPGGATPLAPAPVLLAGASERSLDLIGPSLARLGILAVPVQAGSSSSSDAPAPTLAPGDAVAIALVRGDIQLSAVGTVTDVRGERAWLLGHPLLRAGEVDLALFAADVPAIVANRTLPFKLADVLGDPIGVVTRDAQAGLVADLSAVPDDLPIVIRVDGPTSSTTVTARIARIPGLTPSLFALAVQRTVDAHRDRITGGTAEIAWEFSFGDEPAVRLIDQRWSDDDLGLEVARWSAGPLLVLLENPFRAPDLRRISVRIELGSEADRAELVGVALEAPDVEPGGTVQAFVRLQPFRGEARVEQLAIEVPDDAEPGELVLTFRGASVRDPRASDEDPPAADPLEQATSGLPPVLSWGELIAALENRPQARELIVEMPGSTRPQRLLRFDAGVVVTGLERVTVRVREAQDTQDRETGGEE